MPIIKSRREYAPIISKQAMLLKFDPTLPETPKALLNRYIEKSTESHCDSRYSIEDIGNNEIHIVNKRCLDCGKRLVKNGKNNRIVILEKGLGKIKFRIQRKRCPKCGEIKPDYSKLAPKFGNYHENYKRISRQLYIADLKPSQIQDTIKICFNIRPSLSSIVRWIHDLARPLRDMLKETPVPISGYWGYDEIYMNNGGKRIYHIDLVDVHTKFIPNARIMENMGKAEGRKVLREAKYKKKGLIIKGLIKDGTTNLGNQMTKHGWRHIIVQTGTTHLKWTIAKKIKKFAGLPEQSKKPVPIEWQWLLKRYYAVIDSGNETEFIISLLIVGNFVSKIPSKKKEPLIKGIKLLHSKKDKILASKRNP